MAYAAPRQVKSGKNQVPPGKRMRPMPWNAMKRGNLPAISDIHGNLAALDAVLADVRLRRADLSVNACPARCNRETDGTGPADSQG